MSVSANVLGDVHVKVAKFTEFAKELTESIGCSKPREHYPPVTEDGHYDPTADVAEFLVSLQGRMIEGGLKYGPGSWKHVDLMAELKQELLDVAAYSFLELIKNPGANDMYREWLMSMAVEAYILWREVNEVV